MSDFNSLTNWSSPPVQATPTDILTAANWSSKTKIDSGAVYTPSSPGIGGNKFDWNNLFNSATNLVNKALPIFGSRGQAPASTSPTYIGPSTADNTANTSLTIDGKPVKSKAQYDRLMAARSAKGIGSVETTGNSTAFMPVGSKLQAIGSGSNTGMLILVAGIGIFVIAYAMKG